MVVGVIPVRRGCPKLHTASPRQFHVVPAGSTAGCCLPVSQHSGTSGKSIYERAKHRAVVRVMNGKNPHEITSPADTEVREG